MSSLPAQLSSFVGREQEILRLKALLDETRLLTLVGAGGVGKTRLSLEVAQQVAGQFPDGVVLVELGALADPALVPMQTASALGIEQHPRRTAVESIVGYLRKRRTLLVIDNCEHVIDACATFFERILRECPSTRVLATSREPLRVPGEVTWRVPSLSLPDTTGAESEAVDLFVARARAVMPDFVLTEANATAVAQICRRLDGMPLAIELAAAQIRALSAEQIAERLDDRFSLLTLGARTAVPRQQTLRATVDWSYELLSEQQRRLFRRLSVFAGGWALEAAEAVATDGRDTIRVLTQLIDRSLVIAEPDRPHMRYRLLETIRQYAAEALAAHGEEEQARTRHLEWCVALAEEAAERLHGADLGMWLDRLSLEHDNLRAALRWAEQQGSELQVRLSNALWEFWYIRGHLAEGQAWVDAAALRTDISPTLRARVLKAAAALASYCYNFERAFALNQEALALTRDLGDTALLAACTMNLANAEQELQRYDDAEAHFAEALQLMNEVGNRYGVALTLLNQADLARQRGEHERAASLLQQALPLFLQAGDARRAARSEMYLGRIAFERNDLERAEALTRRALVAFRTLGFEPGCADCVALLASIAAVRGDVTRAARLFGAFETVQERLVRTVAPVDQSHRNAGLQRIQAALGPRAAQRERAAGRALPFQAVLDIALANTPLEPGTGQLDRQRLTAREHEVAWLVAEGLTNRQIADRLIVSERTADAHVRNIFDKLGVRARAQVAAWVASQERVGTVGT